MSFKEKISRRDFLLRSALAAGSTTFLLNSVKAIANQQSLLVENDFDKIFPRYEKFNPSVPVWNVTPKIDRVIHRFHLSSPFSPSGRYLGLTRLSREDRPPDPGEEAEIVLIDLKTGEHKIIAKTIGWDTQLGAQVQWGATDDELFFNDVDQTNWIPFGIKMNPFTQKKQKLDYTIYSVSPNGKWAASTCLRRIGATQAGYGVIVPQEFIPLNKGAVEDDGVYVTDTKTGNCRMIASYKKIVDKAIPKINTDKYGSGGFYGFHVKWNVSSDRLFLVLRFLPDIDKKYKPMLITMKRNGDDIRVAIPLNEWEEKGGNHPNWCPDGKHLLMNLNIERDGWKFVQANYDGTDLKKILNINVSQGHPSMNRNEKFIITDAYAAEPSAFGDGTSPLWLFDLREKTRKTLVRINAVTPQFEKDPDKAQEMRVDLHPAWDSRTNTLVAFNAVENGSRHVFIADLKSVLV